MNISAIDDVTGSVTSGALHDAIRCVAVDATIGHFEVTLDQAISDTFEVALDGATGDAFELALDDNRRRVSRAATNDASRQAY